MARRMLFSVERFRRKIRELSRMGYSLRQDYAIGIGTPLSDGEAVFSARDRKILLDLGVSREILQYSLCEIGMLFYLPGSEAVWVSVVAQGIGSAKILYRSVPCESDLYVPDCLDAITCGDSDVGLAGVKYLLLCKEPVFLGCLREFGSEPRDLILWSVFSRHVGRGYRIGFTGMLPGAEGVGIISSLVDSGYSVSVDGCYVSNSGFYWVRVSSVSGEIGLEYFDSYMGVAPERGLADLGCYVKDCIEGGGYSLDSSGDLILPLEMVDVGDLLNRLGRCEYVLDSIGVHRILSRYENIFVLGFRGVSDYVYFVAYYDADRGEDVLEIVPSRGSVRCVSVSEYAVPLIHASADSFEALSQFVVSLGIGDVSGGVRDSGTFMDIAVSSVM